MCGITGIFYHTGGGQVNEETLTRMRDTMVHRGPDGYGNWISKDAKVGLGHRRLSIIDLSDAAGQPMPNEDGTVWLTFNGEIYNHLALRNILLDAGHQFRTDHSDTEVIVHGYEEWGIEGLVAQLDGDFAFCVWDAAKRSVFLARDRIGVKPVYFAPLGNKFLFGSEIKAILAHPDFTADLCPVAMFHYLSFLTTPAPLTMFYGVYKLPAGYWLQVSEGGEMKAERYWDAVPGNGIHEEDLNRTSAELEKFFVQGIRDRLTDAVEKRMMSDVPFGVFLSGGIDSSTNVALMSKFMDRPVDTFTVGFKDHQHLNELEHASRIASDFNTNHHEILIDESDMRNYLGDLIHHQDEPLADWVCIPLHFVSKLTRDSGTTVIQVGEGSDEQFCGYNSYMGYLRLYHRYWKPFQTCFPGFLQKGVAAMGGMLARMQPRFEIYADIIKRASMNREHFWSGATAYWDIQKEQLVRKQNFPSANIPDGLRTSGLLPEGYKELDTFNVIRSFVEPFDQQFPGGDVLTRMIYNEFKLRLPELLLMRVDKITMSSSLEARVPFLDHRLVEFTMDIPENWKTKNKQAKYLLKKAVEGLIPDEIICRKKMGFGAPMAQWLKGDFGKEVEASIISSPLMKRDYFDLDYIRCLHHDHRSGRRDNSLYIWSLYNLTAWYDYWIESP